MTIQEAISCLKADKEYLVDYKVCDGEEIDFAINIMELQMRNCNTCKYVGTTRCAELYNINYGYFSRPYNVCQDWEGKE